MLALQLAFLEQPAFTFDLKLHGGDTTLLPGMEDWLTVLIRTAILKPYILPERYVPPQALCLGPAFAESEATAAVSASSHPEARACLQAVCIPSAPHMGPALISLLTLNCAASLFAPLK